jgi:MYXO-CTERM domain-containing protein
MKKLSYCLAAASFVSLMGVPATALAATGAEACGNIEILAISECHFEFEGGCQAQCEPLSFQAACNGQCDLSIEASCEAECHGSCVAECQATPGTFECHGACEADCSANVTAQCGTDQQCAAYFEANCSAQCEAECEVVPPSASCEAQCEGACSASCDLNANFDCSLECTAELEGGCEIDCQAPEGALFCDGQYIPVQDLPACIEYLVDNFNIELEAEASASITTSCTYGPAGSTRGGAAALLLGLGLVALRRRRQ